ncbi:MAG: hypothetical protein C0432_03505 [Candidatus Puniceispirillum sp.]|nr:hypothetical protein [Candidatus Pelagibacter sp.]MBA4283341.1 hypothetical protein [Candidatus Puniceispirillum sp.]
MKIGHNILINSLSFTIIFMEIRSSQNSNKTKNIRSNQKSQKSHLAFSDEINTTELAAESQPLFASIFSTIDPLFLDSNNHKKNEKSAIFLSNELLDELEKLKISFLDQKTSNTDHLDNLLAQIQSYTQNMDLNNIPEQLQDILLDIETRTIVEITKIKKNTL